MNWRFWRREPAADAPAVGEVKVKSPPPPPPAPRTEPLLLIVGRGEDRHRIASMLNRRDMVVVTPGTELRGHRFRGVLITRHAWDMVGDIFSRNHRWWAEDLPRRLTADARIVHL